MPKREKVSVTDAIDRKIVRCGMLSKPILRNRLYCLYTFDIIANETIELLKELNRFSYSLNLLLSLIKDCTSKNTVTFS